MTAITPAYDHAYQTICLGMPSPGVPHYSFRVPQPKYRYPFLPNDRSLCKELNLAMTIVGGLFVQMVVPVLWMVKTVAGWGVISRSPRGQNYLVFGPVITTEAHLTFSGARTHSNNTAEMTAMF